MTKAIKQAAADWRREGDEIALIQLIHATALATDRERTEE